MPRFRWFGSTARQAVLSVPKHFSIMTPLKSARSASAAGVKLGPLSPAIDGDTIQYKYVKGVIDRAKRTCEITISAPDSPQPQSADEYVKAGDRSWALRAFREFDDALLRLRLEARLLLVQHPFE